MVNHFFERPAWMVNRRTSLRKPDGKQMINLQRLRNPEEGLEPTLKNARCLFAAGERCLRP
jgi:hypothetical protein